MARDEGGGGHGDGADVVGSAIGGVEADDGVARAAEGGENAVGGGVDDESVVAEP